MNRRLPAEWEPQDAVLMVWPQESMDWDYCLEDVRNTFSSIRRAIERFEPVIMVDDLV